MTHNVKLQSVKPGPTVGALRRKAISLMSQTPALVRRSKAATSSGRYAEGRPQGTGNDVVTKAASIALLHRFCHALPACKTPKSGLPLDLSEQKLALKAGRGGKKEEEPPPYSL